MDTNQLLDAYKSAKNYVQDKQIALDLGISKQKLSAIRNGQRHLTDNEVIFLAENTNIDPHTALIFQAAERAKSFKAQQLWKDITAKLSSQGFAGLSLGITGFLAFGLIMPQYALCGSALC
ncbi:hypothetical protein C0W92_00005 [Photobacterium angustum]|uniref:DUF3693 domain-containing protein n=1 Tax=Photobacterium angustum TaxID=661 RepID=UPI0005E97359|nr:DUF3693 domain-containing protein [Photobacterium angustum]KJG29189.1 antirepressor [Photobacterium angustum]PSW91416.1 hypothetical protein C0W92_00005 [Photobacterium angustum]